MSKITKFASALLLGLTLCSTAKAQSSTPVDTATVPGPIQTPGSPVAGNDTDKNTVEFAFTIPIPVAEGNSTNCPAVCLVNQYGLCNRYNYNCFCDQVRMDSVNCCMMDCDDDEANVRSVEAYLNAVHDQCLQQANLALAWPPICKGVCPSCAPKPKPTPSPPQPTPSPCTNDPAPCTQTSAPGNTTTMAPPAPEPKIDGAIAVATNMWQYFGSIVALAIVVANY